MSAPLLGRLAGVCLLIGLVSLDVRRRRRPAIPSSEGSVQSWKGIPFEAPPVGELRWRARQPAAKWDGIRHAGAFGGDCMQQPAPSDAAPPGPVPAEDCLYLDVWRPETDAPAKLPVVVWIYGGGFVNGGSSRPRTQAQNWRGRGWSSPASTTDSDASARSPTRS